MKDPAPPLPPATFFVLFALAGGDKHGYAIMKETRSLSDDRVRMGPATLYTTIQRLLGCGWIEEIDDPLQDDSRRRCYRLTSNGRSVFRAELERMEAVVRKSKALSKRLAESRS